jgi:hypothetical protein
LCKFFPKAVEVISAAIPQNPLPAGLAEVTDEEILDLLARRPCTPQGVAAGLNLHLQEATKRLHALANAGKIAVLRKDEDLFYQVPMASADQDSS